MERPADFSEITPFVSDCRLSTDQNVLGCVSKKRPKLSTIANNLRKLEDLSFCVARCDPWQQPDVLIISEKNYASIAILPHCNTETFSDTSSERIYPKGTPLPSSIPRGMGYKVRDTLQELGALAHTPVIWLFWLDRTASGVCNILDESQVLQSS